VFVFYNIHQVPLWYFTTRQQALPQVFLDCVREIYGRGLNVPDIFRRGGDQDDVKFLRQQLSRVHMCVCVCLISLYVVRFDEGQTPSLASVDIHTVAMLFKAWLTDLPQPLITLVILCVVCCCVFT
jgi:hypothetical protein